MGRKSALKERNLNPVRREKYILYLLPVFQEHGLRKFTIDELATKTGISKATLYHYFSSKDEMIQHVLQHILVHIGQFEPILKDKKLSFKDRYFKALLNLSENVSGISNNLLSDLKEGYPVQWQLIKQFTEYSTGVLQEFYEAGMEAGEFNRLNTSLLALSDRIFLNALSDPAQLKVLNLTMAEALDEYFKIKCYGLISR
jgi:AcrR family transcriptional regulator